MKVEIHAIIDHVGGVEALRKGFKQVVVLKQPERRDEYDRLVNSAQFFPITIYSNKQTDSRFLNQSDVHSKRKATVYLKGERWLDRTFRYALKLNLAEWQS